MARCLLTMSVSLLRRSDSSMVTGQAAGRRWRRAAPRSMGDSLAAAAARDEARAVAACTSDIAAVPAPDDCAGRRCRASAIAGIEVREGCFRNFASFLCAGSAAPPSPNTQATSASSRIAASEPPSSASWVIFPRKRGRAAGGCPKCHSRRPRPWRSAAGSPPCARLGERPEIARARARAAISEHRALRPRPAPGHRFDLG
jgi:hypothetical protein